jgi:hypothetical protein
MMRTRKVVTAVVLFSMAAAGQGRRGMLNATAEQTAAIVRMNAAIAPQTQRLAAARADLLAAALSQPGDTTIRARVGEIRAAELELAKARASAFAELQSSINKLTDGQIAALAAGGGVGGGGRGGYRTSMPHATAKQASALLEITTALQEQTQTLNTARTQLTWQRFPRRLMMLLSG